MKRILILTAGFGEGHNSAARGIRDGLARVAPTADVELRDLFAETYGTLNELVRKGLSRSDQPLAAIMGLRLSLARSQKKISMSEFPTTSRGSKIISARLLDRFQPDVVVSTFPPFPYLLQSNFGSRNARCKSVVVVTDSITVNAIWYRCAADYFLVPNEQSARSAARRRSRAAKNQNVRFSCESEICRPNAQIDHRLRITTAESFTW